MIYDFLLIGATTLSCGWISKAQYLKKKCAVIETTGIAGYDYGESWNSKPVCFDKLNEESIDFFNEFKSRNAVNEKNILHLPASAPIICSMIKNSGADCFFLSRVTKIIRCDFGFKVELYSIGGKYCISAKKIIDTTSDFSLHTYFGEQKPKLKSKSITVLITQPKFKTKFSVHSGCFNEGVYCAVPFDAEKTYTEAVYELVCMRNEHPEWFGNAKFIHIAAFFSLYPVEKIRSFSSDAIWIPSIGYDNPISAYDAGISFYSNAFTNSKKAQLIENKVDESEKYDIIVAGLGVAGTVAAIHAAKSGLRVIGIESLNVPGGEGTAGAVYNYYQGEHKNGFYRDIDKDGHRLCDNIFVNHPATGGGPRKLIALQHNLHCYNVKTIYQSSVIDVIKDGDKYVTGITYVNSDGIHTVYGKQIIDATADGILCQRAGCEMTGGRQYDNHFTPFSSVMQQYIPAKQMFKVSYYDCGIINQYNVSELSKAILNTNCDIRHLPDSFNDDDIYMGTVQLTGLRDGKHIVGEENMEISKVLNGEFCKNPIFYMVSIIDSHTKDFAFEETIVRDWFVIAGLRRYNVKVPVPVGILIPKGWNGLLAAGRFLGTDHGFSYAFRMMDDMSRSAEAAALIAEYSIKNNCCAKEVPYEYLKTNLLKSGCLKQDDTPAVEKQRTDIPIKAHLNGVWMSNIEEIRSNLASDDCGYAMWSARMLGDKIRSYLATWLSSENKNLKVNSALCMAMCGFSECKQVLLDELNDKSGYTPLTSNSFILPRVASVITACGILQLRDSIEKLLEFFISPSCTNDIPIPLGGFFRDKEDVYFQFRSLAFMSILDILKVHKDLKVKYEDIIKKYLYKDDFKFSVSMSGSVVTCDMKKTAIKIWEQYVNGNY